MKFARSHRCAALIGALALVTIAAWSGPTASAEGGPPAETPMDQRSTTSGDSDTPPAEDEHSPATDGGPGFARMLQDDERATASTRLPSTSSPARSLVLGSQRVDAFARSHSDVIGSTLANAHGYDGAGTRVVVLEGGFDLTHPALAGSVDPTLEACFVSADAVDPCPDDGDADPSSSTGPGAASNCASINCEFGTYAASLVLGRGGAGSPPGVAPAAELVPIRVFQTDPTDGSEFVDPDDLLAALEYVTSLNAEHPVDVVLLSVADGAYSEYCTERPSDALSGAIAALPGAVVAPAGVGGAEGQMGFPACQLYVHGATATGPYDIVPQPANSHSSLLAAPGIQVPGAVPGGSAGYSGTAASAALVAGALAAADGTFRIDHKGVPAYGYGWPTRIDLAAALELRPRGVRGIYAVRKTGQSVNLGPIANRGGWNFGNTTVGAAKPTVPVDSVDGFWTVTSDGRIDAVGWTRVHGSMYSRHLNAPIVAMESTATGLGYWLLGADGGIFSFGDAEFYGSTGGMHLNAPVTDIAATPTGRGYWLTAKDGGVFSFGDAQFFGSTGGMRLNQPVVSMDATPTGRGYWLVALDGGVFSYGDAQFHGSLPGFGVTNETGYRVRSIPDGTGYYITTLQGGVYPFGSASFFGHVDAWNPQENVVDIVLLDADLVAY